jgi:hypothetical protein
MEERRVGPAERAQGIWLYAGGVVFPARVGNDRPPPFVRHQRSHTATDEALHRDGPVDQRDGEAPWASAKSASVIGQNRAWVLIVLAKQR